MRDRSKKVRERRRPGFTALLAALAVLGSLWLGMGGCSNDDINFPGEVPPRSPTGAPTATPDDSDEDA